MINPAWENIIVHCAAPAFKPCQQARSSIWQQFELNGPACLLLHYDCPRSDLPSANKVPDLHLHQVAAPSAVRSILAPRWIASERIGSTDTISALAACGRPSAASVGT
jgi:hypothetical protein